MANQGQSTNSDDKRHQNNGQGFASMPTEDVQEIAKNGGEAAQASGNAHELTDEERSRGGTNSSDKQDMSELGKMGAEARKERDDK